MDEGLDVLLTAFMHQINQFSYDILHLRRQKAHLH